MFSKLCQTFSFCLLSLDFEFRLVACCFKLLPFSGFGRFSCFQILDFDLPCWPSRCSFDLRKLAQRHEVRCGTLFRMREDSKRGKRNENSNKEYSRKRQVDAFHTVSKLEHQDSKQGSFWWFQDMVLDTPTKQVSLFQLLSNGLHCPHSSIPFRSFLSC